ncbi:serine hydrolase domain-containing protein [Amycolatopsis suaedae]|uniref:Class A beta-lactamase-related serine hydrolase n=1 Tax=Amycolatopsis suaedae TaxID=2510978 RepID=A0A4Q7J5F4_9PSEU|nr:serine hydrolase domain-containing protein [Amycolatopsis suaedae]RZQ62329.1 class A beta-lactamase-related serine hydrolase [Amycolatopsis suaedae]
MIRYGVLALVIAMTSVLAPPAATAGNDLPRRMDAALERAAARFGDAGVQAVAIRDGRVIWSGRRGAAIVEPREPVTDRTMFVYASLSKLLLAAFALHQAETGVIDLDRPIAGYVGDEVPGARVVTIRMLLTHTSGYPDLYADPATAPLFPPGDRYDPNRPYTFEMLAPGIKEPVEPGRHFAYSNTGYIVLGRVLTEVSGGAQAFDNAYRRFLRRADHRLGEDQVTLRRSRRAFDRFAHGYTPKDNGTLEDFFTAYGATGIPTDLYGQPFADGLFAGTALGAGLTLDALFARGRMLRPATVRQMIAPAPQSPGGYGMGTYPTVAGGRTWQGHGGAYIGFNSMAGTDLGRGVTVVVLVNQLTPDAPAETIWRALAEASGHS